MTDENATEGTQTRSMRGSKAESAERRTHEAWAESRRAAAKAAKAKWPEWPYDGAKFRHGWAVGALMTEADFDAALEGVRNIQLSSPTQRPAPRKGRTKRGR